MTFSYLQYFWEELTMTQGKMSWSYKVKQRKCERTLKSTELKTKQLYNKLWGTKSASTKIHGYMDTFSHGKKWNKSLNSHVYGLHEIYTALNSLWTFIFHPLWTRIPPSYLCKKNESQIWGGSLKMYFRKKIIFSCISY